MTQSRVVTTSLHGDGFHLCGMQPSPSDERLNLRQDHHPGFGCVTLLKDGERVWGAVRWEDSRTLGWIERTFAAKEPGTWTLEVDGPMVSYTLLRKGEKFWVLSESRDGFA